MNGIKKVAGVFEFPSLTFITCSNAPHFLFRLFRESES